VGFFFFRAGLGPVGMDFGEIRVGGDLVGAGVLRRGEGFRFAAVLGSEVGVGDRHGRARPSRSLGRACSGECVGDGVFLLEKDSPRWRSMGSSLPVSAIAAASSREHPIARCTMSSCWPVVYGKESRAGPGGEQYQHRSHYHHLWYATSDAATVEVTGVTVCHFFDHETLMRSPYTFFYTKIYCFQYVHFSPTRLPWQDGDNRVGSISKVCS
jgi:hypothetical protein